MTVGNDQIATDLVLAEIERSGEQDNRSRLVVNRILLPEQNETLLHRVS